MSNNTQTVSNPTDTDKVDVPDTTVEAPKPDFTDVSTLNGLDWTNVTWPDDADKTDLRNSLPVPDQSVIAAYTVANQSEKAKIRTNLTNVKNGFVSAMSGIEARNVQATLDGLFVAKATTEAIDPIVLIAARVVNLREAANRLESGLSVPKGIPTTIWDDRDMSDLWEMVDKTDFDPIVADSIASATVAKRSDKHDIQSVVDRAFEGLESGTRLTIAQIARRGALPDYKPGSGAIAAALFKSSGTPIKGVTKSDMTADLARGATKD